MFGVLRRPGPAPEVLLAEMNRLEHAWPVSVTESLEGHIAILRKAFAALEAQIAASIGAARR